MTTRRTAATALAAALAGCGFQLVRPPELRFKTIQLSGFNTRSPLETELRRELAQSPTTRVVESLNDAQVVLQSLGESREKSVVAQTAANQIREFELRYRFTFRRPAKT